MSRIAFSLLLCGLAAACATPKPKVEPTPIRAMAAGPTLVANPMLAPRAYTDGVGIVVELLPLKVPDGQGAQALLRVSGAESYLSGVTFLTKRITVGSEDSWAASVNGQIARILQTHTNRNGVATHRLHMNRGPNNVALRLDLEASKLIKGDELIADHLSHLEDGSLEKISSYDRVYAAKYAEQSLAQSQRKLAASCKKNIAVHMDWEPMHNADDFANANFCYNVVENLAMICGNRLSDQRDIAAKIDMIECTLDESHSMSYDPAKRSYQVRSNESRLAISPNARSAIGKSVGLRRVVLKSSHGIYVVLPAMHAEELRFFAGAGPKLYRQWSRSKSLNVKSVYLWNGLMPASLRLRSPGTWEAECTAGDFGLTELGTKERDRVLSTFTFADALWTRESVLLARDDRGIYYYVDRKRDELGGLDYRVYKGLRGQLRLTPMVDIVDDGQGQIYATTSGSLRLMHRRGDVLSATWIEKKKRRDLVVIGLSEMDRLVFGPGNLGIYSDQRLGTFCSMEEAKASIP